MCFGLIKFLGGRHRRAHVNDENTEWLRFRDASACFFCHFSRKALINKRLRICPPFQATVLSLITLRNLTTVFFHPTSPLLYIANDAVDKYSEAFVLRQACTQKQFGLIKEGEGNLLSLWDSPASMQVWISY
jgi:hypothetical protein